MVNLKSEEEVSEYLQNLGIEYRFGCFSEKNPEACALLGDYLEAVKQDFPKAAKIYKTNCDEYNHPQSCYNYGNYAFLGRGSDRNINVAYQYYTKACNLGVAKSCLKSGLIDIGGVNQENRETNYKNGMASLEKACELGIDYSCYYLSGMYIAGSEDDVVKKDMRQAFKFSQKACDLGNMYACFNLSVMYKKGEGVEKNEEMAEKMKQRAMEIQQDLNSDVTLEFERGT